MRRKPSPRCCTTPWRIIRKLSPGRRSADASAPESLRSWSSLQCGKEQQLAYHRTLVDAFREVGAPTHLVDELDALVFPGGYGAVKNLSTFATDGPACKVNEHVERLLREMVKAKKPIGLACIAPVLAARVLGNGGLRPKLTIGTDKGTADAIAAMKAEHENTGETDICVDERNRLAREVHEQEPKNVDYASTYAFSLYLQGDVRKALQVLAGFSEAELERPQIAAYYGVMLANSGDFSRAAKLLDLGEKADLLPEERKLVEKAQLTVARR